jgi:hypothetical protein
MSRWAALSFLAMAATWFVAACTTGPATRLRWPVLAATVAALAVARILHPSRVRVPPIGVPLALLGAYGVVLSAFSAVPALALTKCVVFVATVSACVLGGALCVELWGRDAIFRGWRRLWLVFLGVSVAGLALGRWASGPEGLYGFTGNPNQFAALVGSIGLLLFLPSGPRGWRVSAETAVAAALIVATRSRTVIAAVGAAAIVALAVGRGWQKWALAAAPVLVAGAAFFFLPEQSLAQVRSVADTERVADLFRTRESNWAESWDAMNAGLPFGFGWGVKRDPMRGGWSLSEGRTWGFGREEGTSWLPIGEELGLPGFVLFAWIWIAIVRSAHGAVLQPVALGGITFFLVMATFEGWLLSPGNWESFAFWAFVGIVLASPRRAAAPAPARPPSLPAARAGALVS